MKVQVEVELDIFSGMPNPIWILTNTETDIFMKKLTALSQISEMKLSGNLGYRGFIVKVAKEASKQLIHVQSGIVEIAKGVIKIYANDKDREMEKWLLNTGKPHMKNELFQIVEVTFR